MTIRKKLLILLLPPLIGFVTLISLFFYFNWSREILKDYQSHLKSVVISTAIPISPSEIEWLNTHLDDPKRVDSELYKTFYQTLNFVKQQLPVENLYIVRVEPVKRGEPVFLDKPISKDNPPYDGHAHDLAYRQVFLLEASSPQIDGNSIIPSRYDFSETNEYDVYTTKQPYVTPIYTSKGSQDRFMTGYAPILDDKGNVVALLGADVDIKLIDDQLRNALSAIFTGALATIFLTAISLFFIADKFSKPIQKLNNAALAIAAGQYGEKIEAEGPKEVMELANTLNTMSECLDETIGRLQENALVREWMVGEFECSQLLQHHMLQKVVEDYRNPQITCRLVQTRSGTECHGIWLKMFTEKDGGFSIDLKEAAQSGFLPIYRLITQTESSQNPSLRLDIDTTYTKLTSKENGLPLPLVWSMKQNQFILPKQNVTILETDDLILIYDLGFNQQFDSREIIERWFSKVLTHFSHEGIDAVTTMINNELSFLVKRKHIVRDLNLLIFQVKNNI